MTAENLLSFAGFFIVTVACASAVGCIAHRMLTAWQINRSRHMGIAD